MSKNPVRDYAVEYLGKGTNKTTISAIVGAAITASADPTGDPLGDPVDANDLLPLIETLPTDATDATLVLGPDGLGGVEFRVEASLSFATPAIVLGTAAAAGAAATVIRSDSTIVAFDATAPTTQAFGDAAATGSVAKATRRDHKHAMPSLGTGATDAAAGDHTHAGGAGATIVIGIPFVIDGGGAAITTGVKGDVEIPFACTITGWTLLLDQSGSIVIDIWKDTYANYPPVVGDSITASDKPTVSSATKGQDLAPTGWTTTVTAGDTLRFNVDSITTATRATIVIRATRVI